MALEDEVRRVAIAIEELTRRAFPRPKPGRLKLKLVSERRENEMDLLTYEATLPAVPEGTDVELQRLVVTWPDGQIGPTDLGIDVLTSTFEVPQGVEVTLNLRYVDDGGNESTPRVQTFVATDTIAPDAPGDFGEIRLVSERREDPAPTE